MSISYDPNAEAWSIGPLGRDVSYLHGHSLGSHTLRTFATSGKAPERQYFDAFGGRINEEGASASTWTSNNHLGFTGHEHDDDAGLINMRARMYDPALRRFISPDPVVSEPTRSQGAHPYACVGNNPLRFSDPTGKQGCAAAPNGSGMGCVETRSGSTKIDVAPPGSPVGGQAKVTDRPNHGGSGTPYSPGASGESGTFFAGPARDARGNPCDELSAGCGAGQPLALRIADNAGALGLGFMAGFIPGGPAVLQGAYSGST